MSIKNAGGGSRFSTSLIIGLLLVPLSAVAAVALVTPDAAAEPEAVAAVETTAFETTTSTASGVVDGVVPEIASSDDLAAACGDEGMSLVEKEAEGEISPLEQAALDSLRAICATEGMELPGKPAPEAVVETVTVVAASSGGGSSESSSSVNDLAQEFEEEYAETVAYINAAIDKGARGEMVDLATQLVAEAAALADSGDYSGGLFKLDEAEDAIDRADYDSSGRYDDDDDDDDHDDDDGHDEDDDHDDDDDHDGDDDHDDDEDDD